MSGYGATAVPVGHEGPSTGGAVLYDKYSNAEQGEAGGGRNSRPCRDVVFGILFLLQLAAVLVTDVVLMKSTSLPSAMGGNETADAVNIDEEAVSLYVQRNITYLLVPSLVLAIFVTSVITTCVIPSCPQQAVGSTLVGSLVVNAMMVLGLLLTAPGVGVALLMILLGLHIWYVCRVWRLVPFAGANVKAALQAVNANAGGLHTVALLLSALGMLWVVGWSHLFGLVLLASVAEANNENGEPTCRQGDDCYGETGNTPVTINPAVLFFLLLSLYWTINFFSNAVQTTVAGVVGKWLLEETQNGGAGCGCCTAAVCASTVATFTTSLGSVCLGSLLEAIITALRQLAEFSAEQNARRRPNRNDDPLEGCINLLGCIAMCILACLESIIDYFNQWAYVYVGIYGTSYLESGKQVWELFKERGWTAILTSDITGSVLAFTTLFVSLVCGFLGMVVESRMSDDASFLFGGIRRNDYPTEWFAFGLALILGLWTSGCMMNVVRGAIKTVIVCFVESPRSLHQHHDELAHELSTTWSNAFPSLGIEILPVAVPVTTTRTTSGGVPAYTGTHVVV